MAENSAETAVQEQPYTIRIEDAGPATKKVSVQVSKEQVARKIAEQYDQLRREALVPGFRKGRVPQKLLEKRFGEGVREQVCRTLIEESYEHAVQQNSLQVIGEPEFENPDQIKLQDGAPFTYCFSIEVQPEITLPDYKNLRIKRPRIQVTEEHINQAMTNLCEQQGTLIPVEDRGVREGDQIQAEVHALIDGNVVSHQDNAQIRVRPGRLAGIQVDDLAQQLRDARPGEIRTLNLTVPPDYPSENLRGKQVQIDITVKDIRRLEPAKVDQDFLADLGFDTEQQLRDALREQMEERIAYDVQQAMRRQVVDYLLANVSISLPERLSKRQTDRVVQRRAIDLLLRGVSREQIEANLDRLRHGAADEAVRELKTFFILQKLAEELKVEVSEAELNGRIATIALQEGRRPEKLKQEMARDGQSLAALYVRMREDKALDQVLQTAQIEDVEAADSPAT